MSKSIRKNSTKTKNYRVGFPHDMLESLRSEAELRGVSLSMHIQEILEKGLPTRLGELIQENMKNSIEYEYTSFVITENFFDTLDSASKSVKLNIPELCRDILSHRGRLLNGKLEESSAEEVSKTA